MNRVTISLILAIILALIGVIGDSLIRISGSGPKFVDLKWFIFGSVVYISTIFGWFYVMKYLKFATIGVFYGVSSLLFLVFAGIFFFKEHLNILEIMGIIMALMSMVLLGRFA